MFVRVKTSPNSPKKAVQIVENIRDGKKVRQRIIRHVGTALDDHELKQLLNLAEFIKENISYQSKPGLFAPEEMAELSIQAKAKEEEALNVDLRKLREVKRIIVGIHEVYGKVYKEIGFDRVLPNPKRKPAAQNNLLHIVMARLANPSSKMSSVNDLSENFGVELSLPSVYRMMDLIDDKVIDNIQTRAYSSTRGLFSEPIKVVFYDCTTLYFESFEEDELKKKGYSKDMKFNQSQVLLGLLVTEGGLPLGYELYEGSRYEGHTLKEAIKRIEEKYQIKEVTFVCDSAMMSKENLELLESLGKTYIIGARLKNQPEILKDQILDIDSYKPVKEDTYMIKEIEIKDGKRLIVTYSGKNAMKDAHDRQEAINKLLCKVRKNGINPMDVISNFGYKKYLKITKDAIIEIDEEKINHAARWDGIRGVITNNQGLLPEEVIRQYHNLWQVEESFRITKHDLKVRPVFHWTPRRIKAHIGICFMALTLARHLSYRLKIQGKPYSVERISQILASVQLSILKHIETEQLYGIPSAITEDAKKIYHTMGIKISDVPFKIS